MMKWRVKGFTILELLIALVISGLVIGLIYSAYLMFFLYQQKYKDIGQQTTDKVRLHSLLQQDFFEATKVQYENDQLICQKKHRQQVIYELHHDQIIRWFQQIKDTFLIIPTEIEYQTLNEANQEKLVTDFQFITVEKNIRYPFFYHKTYSFEELYHYNTP